MTEENFEAVMRVQLDRRPFQVFIVELNTGQRIEIDSPHAASFNHGVAAIIGPGGYPHWFDQDSVNQIITSSISRSGDSETPAP